MLCHSFGCGYLDDRRSLADPGMQIPIKRFECGQKVPGGAPKVFAFRRELYSRRRAKEQRCSNVPFELFQPPAQGRLAHSKLVGGAINATRSGHDRE